jgi:hypothetical protein
MRQKLQNVSPSTNAQLPSMKNQAAVVTIPLRNVRAGATDAGPARRTGGVERRLPTIGLTTRFGK